MYSRARGRQFVVHRHKSPRLPASCAPRFGALANDFDNFDRSAGSGVIKDTDDESASVPSEHIQVRAPPEAQRAFGEVIVSVNDVE
jgi:hypothetical protein